MPTNTPAMNTAKTQVNAITTWLSFTRAKTKLSTTARENPTVRRRQARSTYWTVSIVDGHRRELQEQPDVGRDGADQRHVDAPRDQQRQPRHRTRLKKDGSVSVWCTMAYASARQTNKNMNGGKKDGARPHLTTGTPESFSPTVNGAAANMLIDLVSARPADRPQVS
ncbi:hypothetical protein E2562_022682 [Oryza meyeriana var. granulata]|uniref:Uncharacterized protein n=1 Tax=Oryza meyeriana var. granulata TaxID=110450 RepID=A0A6G1E0S4_9ORYZ|nr:hypothetical protein E2562_022682 [Oryza meyeriana var. granulata]